MATSFKRLAMLLGGLVLALVGAFTVSMCGEDSVPYGAAAGAAGGVLLALARRRSALLLTLPGALLGGLVIALRQGGCGDEILFALLRSAALGAGVGLAHDSFRLPASPVPRAPDTP